MDSKNPKKLNVQLSDQQILTAYLVHVQISQQAPCLLVSSASANLEKKPKTIREFMAAQVHGSEKDLYT